MRLFDRPFSEKLVEKSERKNKGKNLILAGAWGVYVLYSQFTECVDGSER
jgi:hypothetical protein